MVGIFVNTCIKLGEIDFGRYDRIDKIEFAWEYKLKIYSIPEVNEVLFGKYFNQPLISRNGKRRLLSDSVKRVKFSVNFNQPIDLLSDNIESLILLNQNYSHSIINLPKNLLSLEYRGDKCLKNLPVSLKILSIFLTKKQGVNWIKRLKNLESLTIRFLEYFYIKRLYPIKKISISFDYDEMRFNFEMIREGVEELTLEEGFQSSIGKIPESVKKLCIFENMYDSNICNLKDTKLEYLEICSTVFNQDLDGYLPNTLRELNISDSENFDRKLDNLPSKLDKLTLGWLNLFNKSLDNLPLLTELDIDLFDYDKELNFLPFSLVKLRIRINVSIKLDNLPPIKKLSIEFNEEFIEFSYQNLPESIETLLLGNFSHDIKKNMARNASIRLPNNLKILGPGCSVCSSGICGSDFRFNNKIKYLPESVEYIILGRDYLYIDKLRKFPVKIIENWEEINRMNFW